VHGSRSRRGSRSRSYITPQNSIILINVPAETRCRNEICPSGRVCFLLVHPKRGETSAGVDATRRDKDRTNETVSLVSFTHAKLQTGRVGSGGSPGGLVKGIMLRICALASPVAWSKNLLLRIDMQWAISNAHRKTPREVPRNHTASLSFYWASGHADTAAVGGRPSRAAS
jgi:hypothetical protein